MKKIILFPIIWLLLLTGCKNVEKNAAPTIEGATSIECIVNSTVDLLDGVIAYDKEDGDITPNMEINITPTVVVQNGYAVFDQAGSYKVNYVVLDSTGNESSKMTDITVIDRENYLSFASVNGFYTEAKGHATLEKRGMYNNIYSIVATGCEVAEDVQLSRVYTLDRGYSYTFRYFLTSATAGRIHILIDGKLADEKYITIGDNIIEFNYNTTSKNTVTISLLLGGLGERIDCIFKGAEIERPQETGMVELFYGMTVEGRFDGTQGTASALEGRTAAKLEITNVSDANWRGGMFLNTGIEMELGKEYVVSFEVERKHLAECEVALQNKQWDEKKYGSILINEDTHNTLHTYTFTPTDENKGSLWFYVQSGKNINEIKIYNLSIKTFLEGVKVEKLELSDFKNSNDGFSCELETYCGGFSYFIETFGNVDYQQKVTSPEFYIEGSGKNYVISFKAKATKPTEVVFASPLAGGWDPTWAWEKFTITEEEHVYTFIGNDAGGDRWNNFVWQFGSLKNQKYNNITIEIWDILISYRNSEYDGE